MTNRSEIEALADQIAIYADDDIEASRLGRLAHHWETKLRDIARRLQPARVTDGWVLVPRELNNAMQMDAMAALDESDATPDGIGRLVGYKAIREVWAALLSAAPAPEAVRAGPVLVDVAVARYIADGCHGTRYGIDWAYHCDRRGLLSEREAFPSAHPAPPPAEPDDWTEQQAGIQGEVVEIGDDESGQPRIVIHTTREAIRDYPALLLFNRVQVQRTGSRGEGGE